MHNVVHARVINQATHRLGVDRVHGEQQAGHCGEGPLKAGDGEADSGEEQAGRGVQEAVCQVEPERLQAEHQEVGSVKVKKKIV